MAWWNGKKSVAAQPVSAPSGVRLPPRGRYENDVTVVQKHKLARLGHHDPGLEAVLGREQAEFLIHHLEMEARDETEAHVWEENRNFWSKAAMTFCGVVVGAVVILIALDIRWEDGRFVTVKDNASPAVEAGPPAEATPDPAAVGRAMADFKRSVAESQARATRAHPSLAVAGSHFNAAFVARYQKLLQQHSPRLDSSDWPERLAEECARDLPATYH